MATSAQIKTLIQSHFANRSEVFLSTALQIAASEARQGHQVLAQELKTLVERAGSRPIRVNPFQSDLNNLVLTTEPRVRMGALVLPDPTKQRFERILLEYRQREKLGSFGLRPRRKILLAGPPGTGKTLTASVLAGELHLPLHTILLDKIVTKFMGETSAKLRQIFDIIQDRPGVYLFDEFDAIGGERSRENDVGEMRRVLNSFLQLLEQDASNSLVVAATNHSLLLDKALFRRFDDVVYFDLPQASEIVRLIKNRLGTFGTQLKVEALVSAANGLSHAEIAAACEDAMKETILKNKKQVTADRFRLVLKERKAAYGKQRSS